MVVSLVYVGRELQSNTAAVRAASMQAVATASAEGLQALALDSAMSSIRVRGDRDISSLTLEEAQRYENWSRQRWLSFQNVYFQHELGVFDSRVWGAYLNIICSVAAIPGEMAEWSTHRAALDEGFVRLVESC